MTNKKIDIKEIQKKISEGSDPSKMIQEMMQSEQMQHVSEMGTKVNDALNIVSEQQHQINENILTYVDFFKEINQRLEQIEQKLQNE